MKKGITCALVISSMLAIPGGNLQKETGIVPISYDNVPALEVKQSLAGSDLLAGFQQLSTKTKYKDGVYKVETPQDYEKYYTKAKLTIKKGKITAFSWTIYDAGHDDEAFDKDYYKVMEPYGEEYSQQAKDDWSGSRGYSKELIKTQNINKVDAVTGATWTCNKFKEVVSMALKLAKKGNKK
jgi:major membrane immunogen (membrane-anchored lipoprotein)